MKSKHLRMMGFILALLAIGSVIVAACTRPGTLASGSSTSANNGASSATASSGSPAAPGGCVTGTVHTLASTFQESCVDVAKGGQLQIIPSVQSFHILDTGSWVNSNPVPMKESGAPTVNNVQVTSSPVSIGPFNVAGTFHIYCTVHQNMNLTINVR
jgi:plastocyanin